MRERNKCQHCGQCSQDDWSRPLDGGLDDRMIWIKTLCLIGMNLSDQYECVPHQDTRQPDQAENGVKSKRLVKNEQRRHCTDQSERAGQHHHPHGRERAHLNDDDRSEEHTSELQSRFDLVCRLLLEKKKADNAYCTWRSGRIQKEPTSVQTRAD